MLPSRLSFVPLAAASLLAVRLAAQTAVDPAPVGNARAAELPGLHNVFHLSQKLYTGSEPEGDTGFRSLAALGIRTVLSVDGTKPDVERAHRFGLRYAHLPFGYDGCPPRTADRIVRAVRDLPGPIYLHCHHGKHRAPTAAAFAREALDHLAPEAAVREMRRAGTDPHYVGLYAGVRAYHVPTPKEIDRAPARFPERASTPPIMEAMVRIGRRFDLLARARAAGWKTPAGLPDRAPANEALQLRELLTEIDRTDASIAKRGPEFREWLQSARDDAASLEKSLRARDSAMAATAMGRVEAGCARCHAVYRDRPQAGSKPLGCAPLAPGTAVPG